MTLRLNSPKTINAQWSTQYAIAFKVNGVPNGTVVKLNLNGTFHDLSANKNYQAWYQNGTTINPTLNQTIPQGFLIYKFVGWRNLTGEMVQGPFTINSPKTFAASYSSEFSLPPIPGFPFEAIILGVLLGTLVIAISRRRRREKNN
jgi:hypothetical protein